MSHDPRASADASAALIHWGPSFELGIEDVDLQHHFFANLINRLGQELLRPADAELRRAVLAELDAYARFHFISEENLMQRAGYPGLAAHRALHHRLLDELSARTTSLFVRDDTTQAEQALAFLVQWFTQHTGHEDREFAAFVQARR